MTKQFRSSHPLSEELRNYLYNKVHVNFLNNLIQNHFLDHYSVFKTFSDEHHIKNEKERSLILNLFWWRILDDFKDNYIDHVEDYIAKNKERFSKKLLIISWLRERGIKLFQVSIMLDTNTMNMLLLVNNLDYYYDKHLKNSSMLEAFIHVLSAALQIEYIISLKKTQK